MENKENNWQISFVMITVLIIGIVAVCSLLFTGCVLNNECIIQYGQDDTMQQEQEQVQQDSLEASLNPPQVKVAG